MTEVYKAINKVMAVMAAEGISKNRNNSQQGYRFRGMAMSIMLSLSKEQSNV